MVDELYAPDHILRAEWQNPALGCAATETGSAVARRVITMWRSALPDFHVVIDRQIAPSPTSRSRSTIRWRKGTWSVALRGERHAPEAVHWNPAHQ